MPGHNSFTTNQLTDVPNTPEKRSGVVVCNYWWLGRVSYESARQLQDSLASAIAEGSAPPTILFLEHPHTFTVGRSGQTKNLLWDEETLHDKGVSVYWIDRGGDVTYHGPGQLVCYPIIFLGKPELRADTTRLPRADYLNYLRQLEEVVIQAINQFGVEGIRINGKTGVWVQNGMRLEKIASIGIKVDSRGVTRHGFAINIAPDMSYWQGIIACGLPDDQMTSLAAFIPDPPAIQQVIQAVTNAFRDQFHYHMVKYP